MEWKDVKGYEGLYQVSDTGLVRSLPRPSTPGKILSAKPGANGYPVIGLSRKSKVKCEYVHRLVASHFCTKTQGREVMHLDGNKLNNHKDNLRFGSTMCNAAFKVEHGVKYAKRPYYGVLNKRQAERAVEFISVGISKRELGRMWGVSHGTVTSAIKRFNL